MRCVQVCDKVQGLNVWELLGTGSNAHVGVAGNRDISEVNCSQCGQCITHCPVGALRERDDTEKVMCALENPDVVTVVQIAPAVRSGYAELLGLKAEEATVARLAGALKQMGFDYVFDTSFTADLTIMEEGSELIRRLQAGELKDYPMFTSCCPGWIGQCGARIWICRLWKRYWTERPRMKMTKKRVPCLTMPAIPFITACCCSG